MGELDISWQRGAMSDVPIDPLNRLTLSPETIGEKHTDGEIDERLRHRTQLLSMRAAAAVSETLRLPMLFLRSSRSRRNR